MTDRNKQLRTQLEGQHRAAAELCARGYVPSIMPERCYQCDMLVLSPGAVPFGLEIKSVRKRSSWWCKRPDNDSGASFWIFVELEPKPRFFVMRKADVQKECDIYQETRPRKPSAEGFLPRQAKRYEDSWDTLPA